MLTLHSASQRLVGETLHIQQPIGEILRLDATSGWRDPIIAYLKGETLPDNKVVARKLQHLVTRYTLHGDVLFKKSYFRLLFDPYLRCLGPEEARKVMQGIHNDDCGDHLEGRSLAHKVINQGYYLPKMFDDAMWRCPQCQRFTLASNRPSTDLHTLRNPWPFMQ